MDNVEFLILRNLLHNEQYALPPPVLQLLPDIYRKLKDMLLNLTKTKNPQSKKFVILLTTALRSFQLTLDRCVEKKKILISESETIILFAALYKFMFLGTKFTQRVL